jgi:uncharacterized coiled-coil protein SlyX
VSDGPERLERRIVELEVRIAYQQETIGSLDEVVREFTGRLARLEEEITRLRDTVADGTEIGPGNDPPPHY